MLMAELEMMTVKEVADYLKMKPVTIYKLAKEGRIPAFKVASFWRFKKDLIEKWAVEESKKNLKAPTSGKKIGETSEV